jgi:hypothetical protein
MMSTMTGAGDGSRYGGRTVGGRSWAFSPACRRAWRKPEA